MRGKNGIATAVRKTNGEVIVNKESYTPYTKKSFFFSLPIIRGFVSLIESLVIGIQTLNYSASFLKNRLKSLNLINGLIELLRIKQIIF